MKKSKISYEGKWWVATHENQRSVEVLVVLLDVVRVVFGGLPLVHRIEVEPRVVVLDRYEERSESILETTSVQRSAIQAIA